MSSFGWQSGDHHVHVAGCSHYASRRSAEWCRLGVDQCWQMKQPRIRAEDREAAQAAYDHARRVYDEIIATSTVP